MLKLIISAIGLTIVTVLVVVDGLPDLETAVYFSLASYATVGFGDVVLPEPRRLLGPIEGTVGVLMLGWSTGILVAVIGVIYWQLFPSFRGHVGSRS